LVRREIPMRELGTMMRRFAVFSCVTAALALAACGGDASGAGAKSSDSISVGFVGDLTGPVAPYSKASLEGSKIAVAEANAAGGVNGR
jgi:branched-chain amino acid transport system substrate-binding protein